MTIARIIAVSVFLFMTSIVAGADEIQRDQETLNRALRQEAITGLIPKIEELVRSGADLNSRAPRGESALDYAVRFGRHKAAIRLVELGADPNVEDDFGVSPLYRAAGDCNASRVVEVILNAGANVNHHDLYGRTALMNAVRSDCARTVAVILKSSKDVIDLDARNDFFQTVFELVRNGLIPQMLEVARNYQHGQADELNFAKVLQ